MAATIYPGAGITTQINVVTVDPETAEQVLEVLTSTTESHVRHLRGFLSANFHVSKDRTRVANYAQWETTDDWLAMRSDPVAGEHIAEIHRLAKPDAHLYRVRGTYTAEGVDLPVRIGDPRAEVVLILEFSTNPYDAQAVAEGLAALTDTRIRHFPGFVGMALAVAEDGTRVLEYVQWVAEEHWRSMREDPEVGAELRRILSRASVSSSRYDVAAQYAP